MHPRVLSFSSISPFKSVSRLSLFPLRCPLSVLSAAAASSSSSSSSSLLHHKVDGWMIHLSPCPRTVVILILLHGLSGPLPFLLERLSVLCSYWHLSTTASAVNTDSLKNNSRAFICAAFIVVRTFVFLNTARTLQCHWFDPAQLFVQTSNPQALVWFWLPAPWWTWLSPVQLSHGGHHSSLRDRPIHVLIVCCSTAYSHSSWASFPQKGWGIAPQDWRSHRET